MVIILYFLYKTPIYCLNFSLHLVINLLFFKKKYKINIVSIVYEERKEIINK